MDNDSTSCHSYYAMQNFSQANLSHFLSVTSISRPVYILFSVTKRKALRMLIFVQPVYELNTDYFTSVY